MTESNLDIIEIDTDLLYFSLKEKYTPIEYSEYINEKFPKYFKHNLIKLLKEHNYNVGEFMSALLNIYDLSFSPMDVLYLLTVKENLNDDIEEYRSNYGMLGFEFYIVFSNLINLCDKTNSDMIRYYNLYVHDLSSKLEYEYRTIIGKEVRIDA